MGRGLALVAALLVAGCASAVPAPPPRPAVATRPPPPQAARPVAAASSPGFIAPTIMRAPGLESVIGADARRLAEIFGSPRLAVPEGDALKLQFAGTACVLDVFLYPLRPGGQPAATHVEARRPSDGLDTDRAACVAALRRP